MKIILLWIVILIMTACTKKYQTLEVGKSVPDYTFQEVLNADQKPFSVQNRGKPIIIEFWTTWCSPCLPAMKKLERIQEEYGEKVEIITVSTDSKRNLNRYIENTHTALRIAFDTTHSSVFHYKFIPHTVLIDKDGKVQAFTTPDKLSDKVIADFIKGEYIEIKETRQIIDTIEYALHKVYKSNDFQFQLTAGNREKGFKNKIERDSNNKPISLEFNNVSIHRLLADIYELSSVTRIYNKDVISSQRKFCFSLEQKSDHNRDLLDHAKEILNEHLDVTATLIEKETDSMYVLKVIDSTKLPSSSIHEKKQIEYRGPYFSGKNITAKELAEYLENEAFQPVKDKTQLDYTFDIELDWSYEDPKTLNKELERYGFKISKPESPEKISLLVLYKK